ncbi:hypothetical protein [Streptomyces collinus]|uniref:hypothetical protein n=1 Tax=Streptomyces collinus TaxID=42684 RepID=UPI00340784B2
MNPPPPDRGAAQRAADQELFTRLQAEGFKGARFKTLEDRFWLYGWRVLLSWMRDGTIIERCREKRIYFPAPYTEVEELMRRADLREDLAVDCLGRAVPAFTAEDGPLREWKPDGGRNLTSFFLHFALYHFRDVYRRWSGDHRQRMREILGPEFLRVYDAEWDVWERVPVPGPEQQTVLRESLGIILAQASMEERAACEAMLAGATQEEIAQKLGTTRKSVERRLSRVRRRARKLAAAGAIVVPSVSSAVTR